MCDCFGIADICPLHMLYVQCFELSQVLTNFHSRLQHWLSGYIFCTWSLAGFFIPVTISESFVPFTRRSQKLCQVFLLDFLFHLRWKHSQVHTEARPDYMKVSEICLSYKQILLWYQLEQSTFSTQQRSKRHMTVPKSVLRWRTWTHVVCTCCLRNKLSMGVGSGVDLNGCPEALGVSI